MRISPIEAIYWPSHNVTSGRWMAVVVIVVIVVLFSFFAPVFPVTSQSGSLFGVDYRVDADASLTFLLSHCGSYVNAHSTLSAGGLQVTHPPSNGYNFQCSFSVSSPSSSSRLG